MKNHFSLSLHQSIVTEILNMHILWTLKIRFNFKIDTLLLCSIGRISIEIRDMTCIYKKEYQLRFGFNILISLLFASISACEKPGDDLWWYSWAIPWSCRAVSNWREGNCSLYLSPLILSVNFWIKHIVMTSWVWKRWLFVGLFKIAIGLFHAYRKRVEFFYYLIELVTVLFNDQMLCKREVEKGDGCFSLSTWYYAFTYNSH